MSKSLARVALLATLLAGTAAAEIHTIPVALNGGQQVPPNASPATGSATVTLDDVSGSVSVSGSYTGTQGTVTASHIHGPAPAGANAGVIVGLTNTGGTSGTLSGGGTLTAGQVNDMLNNLTYINVHSTMFPGGEIRGQVVPPPPAAVPMPGWSLALLGSLFAAAGLWTLMRRGS